MSGSGPVEFSFGCELDERNNATGTPPTVIQTTVTVPAPRALTAKTAGPSTQSAPTPKDIVQFARDRLKAVKAEIVKMKTLVKEHDELERLIAAAEGPAKPKVKTKTSAPPKSSK